MKLRKVIVIFAIIIGLAALFAVSMQWVHSVHHGKVPNPLQLQPMDAAHAERSSGDIASPERLGNEANVTTSIYMPIVMYHHIDENPERFAGSTVTPERFEADMRYFHEAGYETVSSEELLLYKTGRQTLPEKPLMITIDDGYRSAYTYAYPLLKEYHFKALILVIGISVGRSTHLFDDSPIIPHFNWDEAKEMVSSGWVEIQSHSFGLHELGGNRVDGKGVSRLAGETEPSYRERLTTDVKRNARYIEEHLQQKVNVYAYPYGIYNDISEDILRELGYVMTLTTVSGAADLSGDLFLLNRINMSDYDSAADALAILQ